MNKLLAVAAAALLVCVLAAPAWADDVALLHIRFPRDKSVRPVAIEFYEDAAPGTAANFKKLADKGFYKGMAFHRAFPKMLVQVGDPQTRGKDRTNVGTGGPGYTLPAEIRRKHTRGAVAMARLPDRLNPSRVSNGSQFFVCLAPMPQYDGQYTVFGNVLYGLDTLELISTQPVDSNDYPLERFTIRKIEILPREKLPAPPQPATPGAQKPKRPWWRLW